MPASIRFPVYLVLAAALAGLGGCTGSSDAELLASARGYLAKRDNASAIIELRNLLQQSPDAREARFLLGKALLDTGDAAGAEVQLQRALEAGHPNSEVLPLLARAMVAAQKSNLLVQQYGSVDLKDDNAAAEFQTQLAVAYLTSNASGRADAALDLALRRVRGYPPAVLMQARLKEERGDLAGAQALAEELLARAPDNAAAWVLKGDLLARTNRVDGTAALPAYRKALTLQPDLVPAHVAVLSILVGQRDFDAVAKHLEELKRVLPRHPETQYFEGVLALSKGDAKRVRDITASLLRGAQQDHRVLVLAGQAEILLGATPQAEALLAKAVAVAPKAAQPRRMLAQVYLRTGQSDRALATLKPLMEVPAPDAGLLVLVARAQLMGGDAKAAEANFAKAAKLQPGDKRILASAAMARLATGPASGAMAELESIAASDAGNTADLALISERLRRKEYDAALKAVNALSAKQPDKALPDFLRGRIALQRRDLPGARKSFEAALSKDSGYFEATANLAVLDMAEGKPDAARARFEALLQGDPRNLNAHMALARMAARAGAPKQEVAKRIEAAIAANPAAPAPRAALVDLYVASGDTALALSAAQAAVAAAPEDPDLLDRLGRVQQATGDINQAIPTFTKAAALQPGSALPHLRLADAHLANKNPTAAAASVRRALQADPRSLPAQRAGIAVALRENQPAQALTIARSVQAQRPDEALGFLFEGEIELSQKRYEPAIAVLRKAIGLANAAEAAPRLHGALLETKQNAEAARMADSWTKTHPDDVGFALYLSASASNQGNPALAEARYREVLKRRPDNVLALNNLAYLLVKQKKPGAVPLAEQAVKLVPEEPVFMDTLALGYAQENQIAKALELQRRVVALAPDTPAFRLTLAALQIQAGDTVAARAELARLVALGKTFSGQEEVTRMLKTLGG